jgi:hypothetical protein
MITIAFVCCAGAPTVSPSLFGERESLTHVNDLAEHEVTSVMWCYVKPLTVSRILPTPLILPGLRLQSPPSESTGQCAASIPTAPWCR